MKNEEEQNYRKISVFRKQAACDFRLTVFMMQLKLIEELKILCEQNKAQKMCGCVLEIVFTLVGGLGSMTLEYSLIRQPAILIKMRI